MSRRPSAKSDEPGPLLMGHRGAGEGECENTLLSFAKALENGADMVELDVRLCRSGELVVIHDETVDRTTGGKGAVLELTLDELKRLDAGRGERIPTLQEVISFLDRRAGLNIELKARGTALPTATLIGKCIQDGWAYDQFLVSSFDRSLLREVRVLDPHIRLGLLFGSGSARGFGPKAKAVRAYSVNPELGAADADLVDSAHAQGFKVYVWTVDEPEEYVRMLALGADGVITNELDRLRRHGPARFASAPGTKS